MDEQAGGDAQPLRFEATVHAPPDATPLSSIDDMDVDRVPDPDREIRVLADPTELRRLVENGFEVRLRAVVEVRPLDPALVASDDDVDAWFEAGVELAGGPDPEGPDTTGEGS